MINPLYCRFIPSVCAGAPRGSFRPPASPRPWSPIPASRMTDRQADRPAPATFNLAAGLSTWCATLAQTIEKPCKRPACVRPASVVTRLSQGEAVDRPFRRHPARHPPRHPSIPSAVRRTRSRFSALRPSQTHRRARPVGFRATPAPGRDTHFACFCRLCIGLCKRNTYAHRP